MKIRRLLIVFFLLPFYCLGQTADAYLQKGNEESGKKQYREAIADFTKAIALNGGLAKAYFYRANAEGNIKDEQAAVKDFTKALELDPSNTNAWFYRANAYNELKQY